jgi:PIN domain nuclease of toxin-antitoxin system
MSEDFDAPFTATRPGWLRAAMNQMDVLLDTGALLWWLDDSDSLGERAQRRNCSIDPRHALEVERLPRHHTDPFDRLLIAQAMSEGLTMVTGDRQFGRYDVPVIWC